MVLLLLLLLLLLLSLSTCISRCYLLLWSFIRSTTIAIEFTLSLLNNLEWTFVICCRCQDSISVRRRRKSCPILTSPHCWYLRTTGISFDMCGISTDNSLQASISRLYLSWLRPRLLLLTHLTVDRRSGICTNCWSRKQTVFKCDKLWLEGTAYDRVSLTLSSKSSCYLHIYESMTLNLDNRNVLGQFVHQLVFVETEGTTSHALRSRHEGLYWNVTEVSMRQMSFANYFWAEDKSPLP